MRHRVIDTGTSPAEPDDPVEHDTQRRPLSFLPGWLRNELRALRSIPLRVWLKATAILITGVVLAHTLNSQLGTYVTHTRVGYMSIKEPQSLQTVLAVTVSVFSLSPPMVNLSAVHTSLRCTEECFLDHPCVSGQWGLVAVRNGTEALKNPLTFDRKLTALGWSPMVTELTQRQAAGFSGYVVTNESQAVALTVEDARNPAEVLYDLLLPLATRLRHDVSDVFIFLTKEVRTIQAVDQRHLTPFLFQTGVQPPRIHVATLPSVGKGPLRLTTWACFEEIQIGNAGDCGAGDEGCRSLSALVKFRGNVWPHFGLPLPPPLTRIPSRPTAVILEANEGYDALVLVEEMAATARSLQYNVAVVNPAFSDRYQMASTLFRASAIVGVRGPGMAVAALFANPAETLLIQIRAHKTDGLPWDEKLHTRWVDRTRDAFGLKSKTILGERVAPRTKRQSVTHTMPMLPNLDSLREVLSARYPEAARRS